MGNLSNLYISESYQSLIHLGNDGVVQTSLVGLQDGLGNSIGVAVNSAGDLSISGSLTASLQNGYALVGGIDNKTKAVPTSSFGGGGTDLTSLNQFTASQDTKNSTLASYTGSVDTKFATIGSQSGSWINVPLTSLNAFTSSQETKNTTLGTYTGSVDTKFATIGTQSGSWENVPLTSLNSFTASQETKNSTLGNVTASLQGQLTNIGSQSGSWDNTLLNQFTSSQEVLNNKFATTGSNTFSGVQTISTITGTPLIVDHKDATTQNTFIGFEKSGSAKWDIGNLGTTDSFGIYNPQTFSIPFTINQDNSVNLSGPLTASLQEGYAWVGGDGNVSTAVPTSSFAENTDLGPLNSFTSSQETKNSTLASYTGSVNTQLSTIGSVTSSLNSYTSSNDTKWSNLGSQSGSFVTESETGSFARLDVSNTFTGTNNSFQNISAVTASFGQINYVTGSAVIVGDAFIVLNTDTPTLRYAGLEVIDSGSGATASLQWDGDVDQWLVVDEGRNSAYLMTGPTGSLGNEVSLTDNKIPKSGLGNQLVDSSITDIGTAVLVGTNLSVTGSISSNGTSVLLDGALSQLNSFTSSQETKNSTLASYTGSVNTQLTNLSTSQSIDNQKWTNIALQSGSWDETADISNLNAFTASQETKNSTLATYTGSVDTKFATIGTQSGSWDNTLLNQFTSSQETKNTTLGSVTASLQGQLTNIGTQSGSWDNTSLNVFSASQETKDSTLATYTGSVDTKFDTIGTQSGSWENVPLTSLNAFTASQETQNATLGTYTSSVDTKFSTLATYTGSVDTKFDTIGTQSGSWENVPLTSLNAFTSSQVVLNNQFATTGSNTFNGTEIVNGLLTQNVTAPAGNSQKDFISVSGATIGGDAYNYVNQGFVNYPSFGIGYENTFAVEYYNSLSFNYGAELLVNGTRVGGSITAKTSGTFASFRIEDKLDGTTFANYYADDMQIGEFGSSTRTRIGIGHLALPVLQLKAEDISITGSLTVSGSINSSVIPLTITSNTASLNASTGNTFQLNLVSGSATRLEITGTQSGQTINLLVSQSATGPGTLVLGGDIVEPSGSFYSASQVASAEDIVTFATFINPSKVYTAYIKNLI